LLQAVDLHFSYHAPLARAPGAGSEADVLCGVSNDVAAGSRIGILGPNGSGKTTLLKLLSGALAPTRGSVLIDGTPLGAVPRRRLAERLAVVPQDTHLAFDYTVLEIVLMGRYPRLGSFEIEGPVDVASALDALDATGTRALADRPFPTLSGGEKQRVIIASALAQLDGRPAPGRPAAASRVGAAAGLLVLDEPTAALDLRYQIEVSMLVRRLNETQGLTVLLSTHDLRFAARLCSDIVLLGRGRVLARGTPAEVLTPDLVGSLYEIGAETAAMMLGS
jgi:iron complex transport system ATP-binding protein